MDSDCVLSGVKVNPLLFSLLFQKISISNTKVDQDRLANAMNNQLTKKGVSHNVMHTQPLTMPYDRYFFNETSGNYDTRF